MISGMSTRKKNSEAQICPAEEAGKTWSILGIQNGREVKSHVTKCGLRERG